MSRFKFIPFLIALLLVLSCKEPKHQVPIDENCPNLTAIDSNSDVKGFSILNRLVGIWNGPVTSSTPLGGFPEWIVDFRPISAAQIAAKNELDTENDIFMSFFVVKYDCKYSIAFRNGGGFAGLRRNSYMIIDSVFESNNTAFYRFTDPVSGGNRVFSDITFNGNTLQLTTYTNQYSSLVEPTIHMDWQAELQDITAAENAKNEFNFPKKQVVRDFSTTFEGINEAVFYSDEADPYPQSEQPYLGTSDVNITVANPSNPDNSKNILTIISTEPLFNGFIFNPVNLKFRSRYVLLKAGNSVSYNFNYMHPGSYYINAIYDTNGDNNFSSGDFINGNFDIPFTLNSEENSSVNVIINLEIP